METEPLKLIVNLKERSYPIFIGQRLENIGGYLKEQDIKSKIFIITNTKIKNLYLNKVLNSLKRFGFNTYQAIIPDGERYKNLDTVRFIYKKAIKANLDRSSIIVALGGGVVGDISGFVAATFLRGITYIQVPTTLLAMVDSSVGGKTGVDMEEGKNLIGAFWQPRLVWIDVSTLQTLNERHIKNGFAEIIKYGIIYDRKLFNTLEDLFSGRIKLSNSLLIKLIFQSCKIKSIIVQNDEREEKGLREILNFGHTFAHALETYTDYKKYLHGEAVAIGMNYASYMSKELGLLSYEEYDRIKNIILMSGLPVKPKESFVLNDLIRIMYRDKKIRDNRLQFVLPKRIGEVILYKDLYKKTIFKILNKWIKSG